MPNTAVQLKANPFLLIVEDYHEFRGYQTMLENLLRGSKIKFEEISWEEAEKIINGPDHDCVVSADSYQGYYAAWFTVENV